VDLESGERAVPAGELGELVVRGPQVMRGYWNKPAETRSVLRDGWLYTGDIAREDARGFFYLVDRKKDMIKSRGETVYPREVEDVLCGHPAVQDAVVVGVPDPLLGEAVKAYVVLADGHRLSEQELIGYCRQGLAKFKVPSTVEFRKELPRTFVGKALRRVLREEATPKVGVG
jgi:long-chain acyl-CoA synthetase